MEGIERASTHPPIWHKQCRNQHRFFSKSAHSYRKTDSKTSGFHHQNSVGKPPSLMRLGSTGDTVEETSDLRNFEPSNLCGTESNCRSTGIFDKFTKFARSSTNNISKSSSMSLTRKSTGPLLAENKVDLGFLIEKFDHSSMSNFEMEQPRQNAWVMPLACHQQRGMNGFVKEGVYHAFERQGNLQDETERKSVNESLRFLNIGPHQFNHCRPQSHPYLRLDQNTPKHCPNVLLHPAFQQYGSISCNPLIVSSGANQSRGLMRGRISDSTFFRNKFVDPQSQMQSHSVAAWECSKQAKGHHWGHRHHVMKHRPMMTHQQKQNKSPGCMYDSSQPNIGSSDQACNRTRRPTHSKNTMTNPNKCSQTKSERTQTVSGCCDVQNQKLKGDKIKDTLKQSDQRVMGEETVQFNLKEFSIIGDNNGQHNQEPNIKVKGQMGCKQNWMERSETNIASANVEKCWEQSRPAAAELESHQAGKTKSADKESSLKTQTTSRDDVHNHINKPNKTLRQVTSVGFQPSFKDGPLTQSNVVTEKDELSVRQARDNGDDQSPQTSPPDNKSTLSPKPLHSSLAYILAETITADDFSDSDWDVEETPPSSDSWSFLKCLDDPYNPLYGWKCESFLNKQVTHEPTKLDSSLGDDELDSGISSLRAPQDDVDNVSDEADNVSDEYPESDKWSEEVSPSILACTSGWKSLTASDDPYNPLIGCATAPSSSTNTVTDETNQAILNNHVQSQHVDKVNKDLSEIVEPRPIACDADKNTDITTPSTKYSNLHPSVLFILGMDDTDTDEDDDDDFDDFDNFDDCTSDVRQSVSWDPVPKADDPFNPLQSWKCTIMTQAKAPINLSTFPLILSCTSSAEKTISSNEEVDSLDETTDSVPQSLRRMSAITSPSKEVSKPTLKHAASTGCLRNLSENCRSGFCLNAVKKVHFCEASPIFISPETPMWMLEYSASRKGPWEEMARDRCRFMHRIRATEGLIGHVFSPAHRLQVQKRLEVC